MFPYSSVNDFGRICRVYTFWTYWCRLDFDKHQFSEAQTLPELLDLEGLGC